MIPHERWIDVFYSFYKLVIASDEQAEVDIDMTQLTRNIILTKAWLGSEESKFRLDQFYGLLNLYERIIVPSLKYSADQLTPSVQQRLNAVLREAEILSMSKERSVSVWQGSHRSPPVLRLSSLLDSFKRKKAYRYVAEISNETVRIANSMGYPIPGIPKFSDVKYSPPIVNLKPLNSR